MSNEKKASISVHPNPHDWVIFPENLASGRFRGFEDRDNESQLRGAFVVGQNVSFAKSSIPTLRSGYEVIGTETADSTPVQRSWVMETRNGDIFELKAYSTFIYYWLWGKSTDWALLKGGFTAGLEFGFGNIGETGGEFNSFFCNGTDAWYQFNGAFATVLSVTANTITMSESGTFTSRGFYAGTGTTSVSVAGVERTYSGGEGTATLTGVSSTAGISVGDLIVQTPRTVTFTAAPAISQVLTSHDGRLHARSDTKKTVWNYSKLDNPDDFTTGSSDGDGGTKDVEFSGPILAFFNLNQTIVAGKRGLLKALDFVQGNSRIDVPRYRTLAPADDKSTGLGVTNQRSTFSTPYGPVFITSDKSLILLTGITQNDQPDYLVLSDPIQPIFDAGVHDDACGIFVDNFLYYAFKSSADAVANDVVLVGDMTKQTPDANGRTLPILWDTPYVGWGVKDWTSVYNDDEGRNEVHFHSSTSSNSYRVRPEDKNDNTAGFTAIVRTWAETLGSPNFRKTIDCVFVEIRMKQNAEVTATLLFDEEGTTAQTEFVMKGTETSNLFDSSVYNKFGSSPFGTQKFGSNSTSKDLKTYRFYYLMTDNVKFFNISLQLSVTGDGQDFELIRFGYRLTETEKEIERNLLKNST